MKYILKIDDKYFQSRLLEALNGESIEVTTDSEENGIYITDHIIPNQKCILLGSRNDNEQKIINQFQSKREFIKHLELYEWDYKQSKRKVIGFINGFGGSGATVLSLNACLELSKSNPAFHISLDRFPKCNFYLPQDRSISLSDFIFDLKRQKSPLLNEHMSGFQYFNSPYSHLDILEIDSGLLKTMIDSLISLNFNHVVIDLSNRFDLINAYDWDLLFFICPTEQQYFHLIQDFISHQEIILLLNTRIAHTFVPEIGLNEEKHFIIPYDAQLQKGFIKWESELIMSKLKIIFETKLNLNS